jgi:PTS system nitrogen regulatory IIA component
VQAVFIRLGKPLAYGSADGKPVDLLFALVVPEHSTSDHLRLLSQIAEQFSDDDLLNELREADDNTEILERLSGTQH